MRAADVGNPRNGEPSYNALATKMGVATETVRRAILGLGESTPATVQSIADALSLDVRHVSEWVGQARSVREPYQVPPEVDLLNHEEQKALTLLIRAIAKTRRSDRVADVTPIGGEGDETSEVKRAASRPAASRKPPRSRRDSQ